MSLVSVKKNVKRWRPKKIELQDIIQAETIVNTSLGIKFVKADFRLTTTWTKQLRIVLQEPTAATLTR